MARAELLPAGAAFDAIADSFDAAFDPWLSVAAQRRSVRGELLAAFPKSAKLLEIGGGTGSDAAWLEARGRHVFMTDASPAMVAEARRKVPHAEAIAAEELAQLVRRGMRFDGAYSNFAALNCVANLAPVGQALAELVRPGGKLVLVLFGRCCPGEIVTEAILGRPRNCFRRFRRGPVAASLRGRRFTVRYHRRTEIEEAMAPAFRPVGRRGVGLFVPPSAAEPWISRHPRVLAHAEAADRLLARRLAPLGDHVAYLFERVGQ